MSTVGNPRLAYALLLFPGCDFLLNLDTFQKTYGYLTPGQLERVEENIRRSVERRRRAGVDVPPYKAPPVTDEEDREAEREEFLAQQHHDDDGIPF